MGKRKRDLQVYSKKHTHVHRRLELRLNQEIFASSSDWPDQGTTVTPGQRNQTSKSRSSGRLSLRSKATMSAETSEENIENLMSFTGCSRETASRYLKVKKDVERAMNAILDNEDISKEESESQWDESAWSADRDNANTGDRNLRPLGTGTSTAPTRVPSPAGNLRAPTNKDQEDAEFAQALAASQQDLSTAFPQQESGVIGADGTSRQTFGPATRDQYDKSSWAMVPVSQNASSEIVPDVEPEQRKNMDGEPRFLKHLPSGDYLPNFLTIGHSIPAVKEALLLKDYTMAQYGTDAEWWRGNPIALPKIVHTAGGEPADPEIDKYDGFIAETQRLMAVLDASQRSYASAIALTQTELLQVGYDANLVEAFIKRFIQAAGARCGKEFEMQSLFSTEIGTTSPEGMQTPYLEVFDLPVTTTGEDKLGLMEILDGLLWDTTSEDAAVNDNFICQGSDILVMCAKQTNSAAEKLQLDVPPTLFIDKYLEGNIQFSKPARLEILEQRQRLAKISEIEKRLTKWQHPQKSTEELDAKAMLLHTLGHFSGKNMVDATNADRENGILVNGSSGFEQPHYAELASKLEAIVSSVDKKLERLAEQKEAIQKNISKVSNSPPPQLAEKGLKERYTLMGVATKPSITYVLQPEEEDEDDDHMSTDNDDDDGTPDGMQWWRIEYAANSSHPRILKTKVPGYTVLHAAEAEHTSALLVYASDRAVDDSNFEANLPPALQQFVKEDDAHFATELQDATVSRPPPAYDYPYDSEVPRQSIEPGANASRRASIDSTCAQGGSPDVGPSYHERGSFDQHHAFGLPPEVGAGQHAEHREDPEVTEIHLSPPQEDEPGAQHQEMVETPHAPFLAGLPQQRKGEVDAKMEDVRDDEGDGGARQ